MFSKRVDLFSSEIFAALNAKRRALVEAGVKVYDLSVGTPDFKPAPHIIEALRDAAKDPEMWKYALADTAELQEALVSYYERRFGVAGLDSDMLMSCRGTQEGLMYACMALADPGDVCLIPDPCYPVFENGSKMAGVKPIYYPLTEEHDFLPYLAGISEEDAKAAKYMIVSLPANPVGSVAGADFYKELIAFAKKHELIIIHDNAYSDICYDEYRGGSFLSYPGALEVGVEFLSLSKSFNVCGARISFLVGRKDVVQAAKKLRSQVDFGMFLPEQKAAVAALTGPLDMVEEQRLQYQARRDALCEALQEIGWERPNAHGSMFVWAKLPERFNKSQQFVLDLMEKSGVILTPGASFGPSGEGFVRIALVMPEDDLRKAVSLIAEAGFSA